MVLVAAIVAFLAGLGAIIWAGDVRGYDSSRLVAIRNLGFLVLLTAAFFWLVRRERFRGEMLVFTAAALLFAMGTLMQYRLFSDPEYGARGSRRAESRKAKGDAVQMLNLATGYDDQKKAFLFGPTGAPAVKPTEDEQSEYSLGDLLLSANTYIPLIAVLALIVTFRTLKSDRLLLWLQRHALLIGLFTLVPFTIVAAFSDDGKFLGQTTPWEAVKILFLFSFAGLLTDSYQQLRRTRWGLPSVRHLVPFLVIATITLLPFFALSDFGQMLVFLGVYVTLYFIAVRKKAQLVYGTAAVALLFLVFFTVTSIGSGAGVPRRVFFRSYQWLHTWEPPAPETWWWKRDYERYLEQKRLDPSTQNATEARQRNSEAWADKVLQQSQGLFGVNEGGVAGTGLGLGYPETVPVSDSDFIYAAIAEETGLMGSAAVLLGFAILVLSGATISIRCNDMFSKLLAAGVTAFIGLQALVNAGGVLRLLPMTGITLPFVSHGGWSLITSFTMLGVLMAVSHRQARQNAVPDAVAP
jgi:cell division protein FtsW (lipid II flippase)